MPGTVEVELVAAFTRDGAGGNPAGVVLDAAALPREERQRVATAVGAPETAFVRRLGDEVFEVEFYTPATQVPDCGHATVAAFSRLSERGMLKGPTATKRTIIGDREILIDGPRVFMQQPRPAIAVFPRADELARALGIARDAVIGEPVRADHGMPFVLVETTRDALAAAVPDLAAIEALSSEADVVGIYAYARGEASFDATIRMFAPRVGIPEEPATGMAAGLLGGYLGRNAERAEYRFLQGALMPQPSPSELLVRIEPDRVIVGGTARVIRTLHV
ncbi:MAG TPA: PhzF family phenazine biosynthesis protein [Candidatus Elarobacter sp.]|nr:PhzF family phenazine biosynthesis protein [Candidatus Elarobacter sp.]